MALPQKESYADISITVLINQIQSVQTSPDAALLLPLAYQLTLECELWEGLNEICQREQSSLNQVCTAVYMTMAHGQNLEQGIRYFIFDYFRCAATDEGHIKAGHGLGPVFIANTVH